MPKPVPAPVITTAPASPQASGWDDDTAGGWSSSAAAEPEVRAAPAVSLAGLSKEDKEKEMARRREERKAVSGRELSSSHTHS